MGLNRTLDDRLELYCRLSDRERDIVVWNLRRRSNDETGETTTEEGC